MEYLEGALKAVDLMVSGFEFLILPAIKFFVWAWCWPKEETFEIPQE